MPATTTDQNLSNAIYTTQQIVQNIALFEGQGLFEWWLNNCTRLVSSTDSAEYLRRNFPRNNILRKLIIERALSIPFPTITISDAITDKKKREALEAKIKALQERETWEGELNFWGAIDEWRMWAFVTGALFIKLPHNPEDANEVWPERMPAQNSKLLLDQARRKVVTGFAFKYNVGSGSFSDNAQGQVMVEEVITKDAWVITGPGYGEAGGKTTKLNYGFAPVASLQWEPREDSPRGLPLFERLKDKALHYYMCKVGRREKNKKGGQPVGVRSNSTGPMPELNAGSTLDLMDSSPVKKADFKFVETSNEETPQRQEEQDALRELYEEAFIAFRLDEGGGTNAPRSGKAMRQMSKLELKYMDGYTRREGAFLEDLFTKVLILEGTAMDKGDLLAKYDLGNDPDPDVRRADAQFYNDGGWSKKALQVMGNDDEAVDTLMGEREEGLQGQLLSDESLAKGTEEEDEEPAAGAKAKPEPQAGHGGPKAAPSGDQAIAQVSLNGIQVTAILEVLKDVIAGQMPLDGAKVLIANSFPTFPPDQVDKLLASLKGFKPTPPAAVATPEPKPEPKPGSKEGGE